MISIRKKLLPALKGNKFLFVKLWQLKGLIPGRENIRKKSHQTLTSDGAWCWIADPRAVYYEGEHKKVYVGWVNKSGSIQVASYNRGTKKITTTTLKKKLQRDDHANPALLVRPDGRLMVFYSAHNGKKMFYHVSKEPENVSSWDKELEVGVNTEGARGYTYPNPIHLATEGSKIYLFWRGGNWKPSFAELKEDFTWSSAKTLVKGEGKRPYVKFDSNGIDKIHFAFTDGHPGEEEKNNIYYAYYYKGAFYKANGFKIKNIEELPINPLEADKVYDAAILGIKAWVWDIALDHSGNPIILYAVFRKINDHRYRYAQWDGEKWNDYEITAAGNCFPKTHKREIEEEPHYSGGVALDHDNPSIVYLSRPIHGIFEIEKWVTSDGGTTWDLEEITSRSAKDNIRPVVARNYSKSESGILIWMQGNYYYYTQYYTGLKMYIPEVDVVKTV
ncbi:MAG: BNR-4 repeat-containing protein [Candidatus Omnitrophota bacterium]|nr:MAG: BNR-4 repeat-containing protein [Candidatus Omnitrophota bacterium]